MKKLLYYIMVMMVAVMTASCSSVDCNLEGRVLCHYEFQGPDGNLAQLINPLSVTLQRTNEETDSVYINQMQGAVVFDVPMSYSLATDTMTLTLHGEGDTGISDKVYITKENHPTFEDVDCAPRYNHTITHVSSTHNFIDTLIINNEKVNNDASVKNIYIRISEH